MLAHEIKVAVLRRSHVRGVVLLLSVWMAGSTLHLRAQGPSQQKQVTVGFTLSGRVVDALGKPIGTASVTLRERNGTSLSTATDASGSFIFKALRLDTYTLVAERSGVRSAAIPVTLSGTADREVRIVIQSPQTDRIDPTSSPHAEAIEFSDKPNFTVAGVTDWTAVGGHGSDATLRTSEDLTRETLALKVGGTKGGDLQAEKQGGDAEEATLRAAVARKPRDYDAVRNFGYYYLRTEHYEQAVPLLKSASDLSHGKAEDEFNLALACQGVGDFRQARQHVEHALAQKDAAEFHRLSGELDEKLGDSLSSVQEEERATRMNPGEENYFVWGSELLLHRAIWQAAEVFANGTKAHPSSARMKAGWGAALFAGARYDEAAQRLCDASDQDPTNQEPYLFLGRISVASPTSLPCVQQKLERFVQLRPNGADANYFYAMFLLKRDSNPDLQQVESLLRKAVAADPKYSDAYLQLGILSFAQQRYPEAIGLFTKAVEADPQQAEAHYRLGVAYDRTGKPVLAQEEFQIHDKLVRGQADAVEQQRRQVKQFLVVLQGKASDSTTQ